MNGYTQDDLIRVRAALTEIATRRKTITYTDLANRVGLKWDHKNPNDRKLIGQLLGEVSRQEYSRGRPLLTAVVVRKGEDMPGPGFRGLEGFPESDEFYETELRRVHDFWEWRAS